MTAKNGFLFKGRPAARIARDLLCKPPVPTDERIIATVRKYARTGRAFDYRRLAEIKSSLRSGSVVIEQSQAHEPEWWWGMKHSEREALIRKTIKKV